MTKRLKTVSRVYGGSRCHHCVRNRLVNFNNIINIYNKIFSDTFKYDNKILRRIVRAFLIEEQKIVVKVIKAQQKSQATSSKKKK